MELQFDNQTPDTLKPVTVLGRTFATDEERRTYFREELRKLLPELKKIEGFPIGVDEDILKLSDPPYYTACPNPWLNDFIKEWEVEKIELEAQGKRVSNFEVEEPYATAINVSKNHPIYNAHSYHTKVPHQVIMKYYLYYTQPGDIVLDSFAGTGMSGVAANSCAFPEKEMLSEFNNEWKKQFDKLPTWGKRNCILGDLSPITSFITYNYTNQINKIDFEKAANTIFNQLESELGWTYKIKCNDGTVGVVNYVIWSENQVCPNCNSEFNYWDIAVNFEKNIVSDEYLCPHCNRLIFKSKSIKAFSTEYDSLLDMSVSKAKYSPMIINYTVGKKRYERLLNSEEKMIIEKANKLSLDYEIPISELKIGDKTSDPFRLGVRYLHQFYSHRNLLILSRMYDLINSYKCNERLRNYLKIWFTSCQSRLHLMNRYAVKHHRHVGPMANTLYISSTPTEISPFYFIKSKIKDNTLNIYSNNNIVNQIASATTSSIKNDSIDYIFTDPPFGANIMYSELNFLWESWLKVKTNNTEEAISNKSQNKGIYEYQLIMLRCLKEYYRVLKPNKWMTVEFSNTSASVWNAIQNAIQRAGFVISSVTDLSKGRGGLHGIVGVTAVNQDLAISCYKPSSVFDIKFQQSQHSEVGIWDFILEHLSHLPVHLVKENATTAVIERSPKILFDRLIAFYVQRNLPVPIDAGLFQKGLKERFIERDGMYFTAEQVHEYDSKKAELPNFVQLSLLVASEQDGVMWLRRELEHTAQTYQELQPKWMQALAGVRKGDILPELKDILEENFLQNESGAWYLPDLENEIDLEKVRTGRMLRLFATYREQASKPKGKIKEARVEALRVGFKQCYKDKDFKTIVTIGDSIPNNLLMEDEVLLQYYDIAISRV